MKRFLAGVSFFSIAVYAQFPGGGSQHTIRGQVMSDVSTTEVYTVELYTNGVAQTPSPRAYTTSTGDFEMQAVSDGDYQLKVMDKQGRVLQQQMVRVDGSSAPLEVRLPGGKPDAPPSGSVTFAALSHKVPRKVRNELKAAEEARRRGDHEKSVEHLQKALRLDPDSAAAHNDIATDYIGLEKYEAALVELDRAEKLDPAAAVVPMNRAACLLQMGRLPEAETAARRAVQLNGASPRTRYALGLVLAKERKFTPEAIENLLSASAGLPSARLLAAQIYYDKGRVSDAREQLRKYLAGCSGESCKKIRNSLAQLETVVDSTK